MRLPDRRRNAPKDPRDRAAFLHALDLAEHFIDLATALGDFGPSPEEVAQVKRDLRSTDPATRRKAELMSWGHEDRRSLRAPSAKERAAAREKVEAARLWLERTEVVEHLVEAAIVRAVRWCVEPDTADLKMTPEEALAWLRRVYPREGERIQPADLAAAVKAWREGTKRKWDAVALVVAAAVPAVLKRHGQPTSDPGERDIRLANAIERRDRRHRTGH